MSATPPRVRFAPSPTGFMNLGNLRTALYNWLFAKKHGGTFILRLEDTDRARLVEGAEQNILETLRAYNLVPFEGPYKQSERLDVYKQHATLLLEKGAGYRCFCSPDRLAQIRKEAEASKRPPKYDRFCLTLSREEADRRVRTGEPHVIRLKIPDGETLVHDIIHGEVVFENTTLDDQVLLKSDGFPTYHLANVVDDHAMNITHVIRGDDWLPSTPKHLILYAAFGWKTPEFAHLPLILGKDKSKLSKRHGAKPALEYLTLGYLPQAVLNFIALLGWNPGDEREVFTLDDLVQAFDLKQVNRANPVFDEEKLQWFNQQHMLHLIDSKEITVHGKALSRGEKLFVAMRSYARQVNRLLHIEERKVAQLIDRGLFIDRMKRLGDFLDIIDETADWKREHMYKPTLLTKWKGVTPELARSSLEIARERLRGMADDEFVRSKLKPVFDELAKQQPSVGAFYWPLRVALSGREKSPPPEELIEALVILRGRGEVISRIEGALEKLKNHG